MKLLLCSVLLIVSSALVKARDDPPFPGFWINLDSPDDYEDDNFNEPKQEETDQQVYREIEDFMQANGPKDDESKQFDALDYQIEDNRSNSNEKGVIDEIKSFLDEPNPENDQNDSEVELSAIESLNDGNNENTNEKDEDTAFEESLWNDLFEDDVDRQPLPDADEKVLSNDEIQKNDDFEKEIYNQVAEDEAVQDMDVNQQNEYEELGNEPSDLDESLQEDNDAFYDNLDSFESSIEDSAVEDLGVNQKNDNQEAANEPSDLDEILKQVNVGIDDNLIEFESLNEDVDKSEEDLFSENNDLNEEEDTPQKVYADINADLDKLFETLDKLTGDNSEISNKSNKSNINEVKDYEEKFNVPFREGNILNIREDYENFDGNFNENNAAEEDFNSNEQDDNSNLELLANNSDELPEADDQEPLNLNKNDNYEDFDYEEFEEDADADVEIKKAIKQIFSEDIKELPYGDDGLTDEQQLKNEDAEVFDSLVNNTKVEDETKSVMVDDLSSAELSDLMAQFVVAHKEDLDVHSENFGKNVAPIHVTLSVNEPVIIESPNYPDPYPTNNIVDWVFEGPGTGIELNITDFAVNGALGDYLLVKPGGINETGTDGLIFSYRLDSERRYRFTDVNRMFVRFESKMGMMFLRGFQFSVKMIWPLAVDTEDEVPEPEPVIHHPEFTITVYLGGISVADFPTIKEDFIKLVADMATDYIKENELDMGNKTTMELTQITSTSICNTRWPDHEDCVQVTFGVPLENDEEDPRLNEEDLHDMWSEYIKKEQFASRLAEMGVTEYAVPDDGSILTVWLVIAFGVVISMSMLAFALWRFSCFQDYTRMTPYSDTDSLKNEKRNLDLYPTPHQTLPPLYTENDYKWADQKFDDTRVDMGGFANKNYVRDDLFDIDSDEDVVVTNRDRYTNV